MKPCGLVQPIRDLFRPEEVVALSYRVRGIVEEARDCRDPDASLFLLGQAVDCLLTMAARSAPARCEGLSAVDLLRQCGIPSDAQHPLLNALSALRVRLTGMTTGGSPPAHPPVDMFRATGTIVTVLKCLLREYGTTTPSLWRRGLLRTGVAVSMAAVLWAIAFMGYAAWKQLQDEGLRVNYYRGESFEHMMAFTTEFGLFKDYRRGSPVWWMPKNHFSSRWEGWLLIPVSTNYSFYSQSDDGLRLKIDGMTVLDNWRSQTWEASGCHGDMFLERGPHKIVVEHYDAIGTAGLRVRWCGGPIPRNTTLSAPFLSKTRRHPPAERPLQ